MISVFPNTAVSEACPPIVGFFRKTAVSEAWPPIVAFFSDDGFVDGCLLSKYSGFGGLWLHYRPNTVVSEACPSMVFFF